MESRINKRKHWLRGLCLLCLVWGGPLFAQTITLNLKDADINALIGTVAEVTGKNFIVDPRVKGTSQRISVQTTLSWIPGALPSGAFAYLCSFAAAGKTTLFRTATANKHGAT